MPPNQNPDPNAVKAAHTTLQRLLLDLLADQQGLNLPIGFDGLLRVMFDRFAALRGAESLLGPSNVAMALDELSNLVNPVHPGSVRFDRGGLVFVEEAVLRDFRQRLMGQSGQAGAPPEAQAAEKKGRKLSTGGLGVDDGDEAEMLQELLGKKSIKQQAKQEQTDELRPQRVDRRPLGRRPLGSAAPRRTSPHLVTPVPPGAGTAGSGWRSATLEERLCRAGPNERPRHRLPPRPKVRTLLRLSYSTQHAPHPTTGWSSSPSRPPSRATRRPGSARRAARSSRSSVATVPRSRLTLTDPKPNPYPDPDPNPHLSPLTLTYTPNL